MSSDLLVTQRDKILMKCKLAIRYAKVGKYSLAKRQLGDAEERLQKLSRLADVNDSPVPNDVDGERSVEINTEAEFVLRESEKEVEKLRGLVPVSGNETPPEKTVLIFGLSANPPTGFGGHAGIVSWAAHSLKLDVANDSEPEKALENIGVDEVWVLPVYRHAFSNKSDLISFDDRMAMAKLAFEDLPGLQGKVVVKDTEKHLALSAYEKAVEEGRSLESVKLGSVDLVEMLQADHPNIQFALAFGGDTYRDYAEGIWKGGRILEEKVPLVVISRKGVTGVEPSETNAPKLSDISSTKVRASTDIAFLKEVLHPKVLEYIKKNQLYGFNEENGCES